MVSAHYAAEIFSFCLQPISMERANRSNLQQLGGPLSSVSFSGQKSAKRAIGSISLHDK